MSTQVRTARSRAGGTIDAARGKVLLLLGSALRSPRSSLEAARSPRVPRVSRSPRPRLLDSVVAVPVTVVVAWLVAHVAWRQTGFERPDALTVALAVAGTVVIAWRRVYPLAAVTVCTCAIVVMTLRGHDVTDVLPLVACVLLLSLAYHGDPPAAAAGLGIGAAGFGIVVLAHPPGLGPDNVSWTYGLIGASWLSGRLLRDRRAMLVARADTAEQRAAAEADRAALLVSEERLRIARELHDILSHTVSVIAVQATVGEHLANTDPDAAGRSLGVIGATSRDALDELRRLLAVLRDEGGEPDEDTADPVHSLADVEPLVRRFQDAGLTVRVAVEGVPRTLSSAAEACGYRIVQEALTNVLRHAGGTAADVVLVYRPDALLVTVSDDGNGTIVAPARAGHGITGMRERAALFGGGFSAAPRPGGGFEVRAELPHPERP
ncbi:MULTISPECIES: sensor histidine kinase [Pseudofrankia]|uniref:sensor histidine kinase n=1 Tax=Pseudofrankia TaxID=2994363 RepID=UPI000234C48D|nr:MULTISPECIES: sensor histidine kinase [Pseudofrankia]